MIFLTDDLAEKLNLAILREEKFIEVEENVINTLNENVEAQRLKNNRINECAELNNQGIAFEKAGEIKNAIAVYEKNIIDEYPATHAYERLVKIYRRLKQPKEEIRILKLAVSSFSRENERRYKKLIADPKNEKYLTDLQTAHETCNKFKGDDGWYIYVPYPLMNYIEQIEKCERKFK